MRLLVGYARPTLVLLVPCDATASEPASSGFGYANQRSVDMGIDCHIVNIIIAIHGSRRKRYWPFGAGGNAAMNLTRYGFHTAA